MNTLKEIIYDIADHLPDHATFDDAMYALYIRQKLDEGLSDLDAERTYTQEEVEQRLIVATRVLLCVFAETEPSDVCVQLPVFQGAIERVAAILADSLVGGDAASRVRRAVREK